MTHGGIATALGPRPEPGRGVFETLLVLGGRPVELEAHLQRLAHSLGRLFAAGAPRGARELVLERARAVAHGRLRLTVAPADDGRLVADVAVAPVAEELVFPSWAGALELARVAVPGGLGAHKWADRRLLERAEANCRPALPLLVDADGGVLEASRGNLFVVRDGAIATPPADGRILPGVARARILAVADALGLAVGERPVPADELLAADEVFVSGSVRGVEPVRGCDGARHWAEGRLTPRIAAELRRLWIDQAGADAAFASSPAPAEV